MIHVILVIVAVVWLLAILSSASDDPNAGVMRRWLDNERFKHGR